jgi:hypothetical protein
MTPWQEYKKKRQEQLNLGASVRPADLLDKNNYTSEEKAASRYSICEQCPSLIKLTHQCKECGCFMNLKVKLELATCPLGKW